MRLYLDTCCLQRPFDDQTQARIRVETESFFAILATVQDGTHSLLTSEALEFEVRQVPDAGRRRRILAILDLATERFRIDEATEALILEVERQGVRGMDAVHLALASAAKADRFCTCDDRLLRKARSLQGLACRTTDLLDLVTEVKP